MTNEARAREMEVEGSIYDGFAACLVRDGKTVAHVFNYADALEIAAALSKSLTLPEDVVEAFKPGDAVTYTYPAEGHAPALNLGAEIIGEVEGWWEVRFAADKSTCVVRPSRLSLANQETV